MGADISMEIVGGLTRCL